MLTVLLLGASIAGVVAPQAGARTSHRPPISVLNGATTLEVTGANDSNTASASFTVLNRGRRLARINVGFQASTSETLTVVHFAPKRLAAGKARLVKATFAGLESLEGPASGQLVVTGGRSPVAKSVEVSPAIHPSAEWPTIFILASLGVAALAAFAVIAGMPNNDRTPLGNRAPGPKWRFDSWATTLTGLGGVLSIVLTQASFPSFPVEISKQELVNLSAFFATLVILAPFIFNALRKSGLSASDEDEGKVGTNRTLLLASTITFWAVVGQLATFGLLSWELLGRGTVAWFSILAVACVGLLALRYYYTTMSAAVTRDWTTPTQPTEVHHADVSEVESLYLRSAGMPIAAFTSDPEHRTARVTVVSPPGAPPSRSWPLL